MGKTVFLETEKARSLVAAILILLMAYSVLTVTADHQREETVLFSKSSYMNINAHIYIISKQAPSANSSSGESPAQDPYSIEHILFGIWGVITTGLIAYDTRRCNNPRWLWWIIGNILAYPIVPFIYLWTRREAAKSFINSL
jgi:hypothetical protein